MERTEFIRLYSEKCDDSYRLLRLLVSAVPIPKQAIFSPGDPITVEDMTGFLYMLSSVDLAFLISTVIPNVVDIQRMTEGIMDEGTKRLVRVVCEMASTLESINS